MGALVKLPVYIGVRKFNWVHSSVVEKSLQIGYKP
jgi:hypothetical protein